MIRMHHARRGSFALAMLFLTVSPCIAADGSVSVSFGPSGIKVYSKGNDQNARRCIVWPISDGQFGRLEFSPRAGHPVSFSLAIAASDAEQDSGKVLLKDVEPVTFVTVGSRVGSEVRPPSMSVFNTFFDSPAQRPHQSYEARWEGKRTIAIDMKHHVTIRVDGLTAGPFSGSLQFTVYPHSPLVQIETLLSTGEDRRAYLYDMGLASDGEPSWKSMSWMDTEGKFQSETLAPKDDDRPLAVRHRTLIAEGANGSVACFPPPHQYFFARDLTDNLRYVWFGKGHRKLEDRFAFGIRQSETGGGSFAPWISAPPGMTQHLGMFLLLSPGNARQTLDNVLRYTHGDRFPDLSGHVTFTSHWHMAIALAAMKEIEEKKSRTIPDLVNMFKDMNVNIVHLGEFHGDGHPRDPGPVRIAELDALFAECRRLSDPRLLLLPGEEANAYLGLRRRDRGQDAGHYMLFFPRPVYWTMVRGKDQPFAEQDPSRGTVYHVGSVEDMMMLLQREHGLAWTAHPRIKASSWTPDGYKDEDFYKADSWLGAAWKGMPADLSQPKLGTRALDLLDDMANWGQRKYMPGEVDVFKIDHTHELYGHMNVNYLRLDRVPRFDEGWQPVLDALRGGRFFVTTGEIIAHGFDVGGKHSGDTLRLGSEESLEVKLEIEWTFPLKLVELISGDGERVYRKTIDVSDTESFGRRRFTHELDLKGRKWLRLEAWDVATNGLFTQPVWIAEQ